MVSNLAPNWGHIPTPEYPKNRPAARLRPLSRPPHNLRPRAAVSDCFFEQWRDFGGFPWGPAGGTVQRTMAEPSPPSPLPRPPCLLRRLTEGSFLFLVAFVVAGGVACYWLRGPEVFWQTSEEHLWLLLAIAPVLAGAGLLGGFIPALVPPGDVRARLGGGGGVRGIGSGRRIGLFVPGGPTVPIP